VSLDPLQNKGVGVTADLPEAQTATFIGRCTILVNSLAHQKVRDMNLLDMRAIDIKRR
jgi:hypothetical protein